MPPELPGIGHVDVNPDGTLHLHYTTTDGTFDGEIVHPTVEHATNTDNHNNFRDLVYTADLYNDTLTIDPAEVNIPDTTIHVSDCYGNTWASLPLSEERLKEIIRETVKELLEQEGYIIGKIPNQPSDLPIGE